MQSRGRVLLDHEACAPAAVRRRAPLSRGPGLARRRRRLARPGEIALLGVMGQRLRDVLAPGFGKRLWQPLLEREHRREEIALPPQPPDRRRRREKQGPGLFRAQGLFQLRPGHRHRHEGLVAFSAY